MIIQREKIKFPLAELQIGHSFFCPAYDEKYTEGLIRSEARKLRIRVSVVAGIERGVFGLRIIRVA